MTSGKLCTTGMDMFRILNRAIALADKITATNSKSPMAVMASHSCGMAETSLASHLNSCRACAAMVRDGRTPPISREVRLASN